MSYTKITVYFNGLTGSSKNLYVPWASNFDQAQEMGVELVVMTGGPNTGLYVRNTGLNLDPGWKLALTMDLVSVNPQNISVVLRSNSSQTFSYPVYRNGQLFTSGQVLNDPGAVWALVGPFSAGATPSSPQASVTAFLDKSQNLLDSTGLVLSRYATPAQKLFKLGSPIMGWNCFSLLYDLLNGNGANNQQLVNWMAGTGAKVVRIMYPTFSDQDWIFKVFKDRVIPTFQNGTLVNPVTTDTLNPAFVAASDAVYDMIGAAGMKILCCNFWQAESLPTVFGETVLQAFSSLQSMTMQYAVSFEAWRSQRYASHPAQGLVSYGNEYRMDVNGVNYVTPQQLGVVMSALANATRIYDGNSIITSDFQAPELSTLQTRDSLTKAMDNIRAACIGLDAIGVHPYNGITSYMGRTTSDDVLFAASPSNDFGYEGTAALVSAMRAAAAADGKPLFITETSVETSTESDAAQIKKRRLLRACVANADLVLIWNVQSAATAGANQQIYYIDPTKTRGNTWASVAAAFMSGRSERRDVGGGIRSMSEKKRPRQCWTPTQGTAGSFLTVSTPAAPLTTATSYAVMFWFRLNASQIAAFEWVADLHGASTNGGFGMLGDGTAGLGFYIDFRATNGASAGNTASTLLPPQTNDWHHVAFVYSFIGSQPVVDVYQDGLYLHGGKASTVNAFAPITAGTTLKIGGQSVGGPLSIQDFAILPGAGPDTILAHIDGAVSLSSLMHLRADADGVVRDYARVPSTGIALGTGCVVENA